MTDLPFAAREPGARRARSYSQIRQYVTCGEQFRLERIEKVEGRPSTAAVAGRIIHSATEAIDHLLFQNVDDENLLFEAWTNAANEAYAEQMFEVEGTPYADPRTWITYGRASEAKPRGEDLAWFVNQGIPDCISSYTAWRLLGEWDVLEMPDGGPAIEIPFEFKLPSGLPLRGVVDRIFVSVKTGQPLVVDLKSGQKPKSDGQLALYKFGLEKLLSEDHGEAVEHRPSIFNWGAYYYGMKRGGTLTSPVDLSYWTPEMLQQLYDEGDRGIEAGIFIPNPGEACLHCGVSRHCAFERSSRI